MSSVPFFPITNDKHFKPILHLMKYHVLYYSSIVNKGELNVHTMLLIVVALSTLAHLADGAPHGCSHDGTEYRLNQKIKIGCDECICLPGRVSSGFILIIHHYSKITSLKFIIHIQIYFQHGFGR